MELKYNESIIRESKCRCRVDSSDPYNWNNGKCYLTNTRIIFESYLEHIERREAFVELENIFAINAKANDFIHSKISILLKNNSIIELVFTRKRSDWLKDMGKAIKGVKKETDKHWELDQILNVHPLNKQPEWTLALKSLFIQLISLFAIILILTLLRKYWGTTASLTVALLFLVLSIYLCVTIGKKEKLSQKIQGIGILIPSILLTGFFTYNTFVAKKNISIFFWVIILLIPLLLSTYISKHFAKKENSLNLLDKTTN